MTAIAATCIPLLAVLLAILFTYTYRQSHYVDGVIGTHDQAKCGVDRTNGLVGIVEIDELSLAQIRKDESLLVLVPAVSGAPMTARVVCISDYASSLGSKNEPAQFDVVLSLSASEVTALSQKVRAGMTIRAQTGHTDIRLLTLFIKDRDNAQ